ncbi:hypothetical protein LHYA1_G008180 [Lachnellula hyalina]|uniref:DUF5071 domain-containing protein n=1 Tax=Lachnellula hyalina TaxID=1316788 RepID=A0A8H8TV78_9HELO|nr:uncharacterized protein LHYA1_G008180 [Lachnellula hyalina]TVY23067.1 hypothetical protein LHYA1_G008180 [Lachnellula hyalina]
MSSPSSPLTPSQKTLLPADKHDTAAIDHLSTLPSSTIAPLIPELLTWVQDINWPIAAHIISLLLTYPHLLVEPVRGILLGSDDGWKYNCLVYLVDAMPIEQQWELRTAVERTAENPTEGEFELDEVARDILGKIH